MCEDAVNRAESDVVIGLDVEVGLDEDELLHVFHDAVGKEGKYLLELEVVVGGGSFVIEVDEGELLSRSA